MYLIRTWHLFETDPPPHSDRPTRAPGQRMERNEASNFCDSRRGAEGVETAQTKCLIDWLWENKILLLVTRCILAGMAAGRYSAAGTKIAWRNVAESAGLGLAQLRRELFDWLAMVKIFYRKFPFFAVFYLDLAMKVDYFSIISFNSPLGFTVLGEGRSSSIFVWTAVMASITFFRWDLGRGILESP